MLIIIIIIYLLSLCTHCICAKCRGRTLKVYVEDKCCVKYQTAHFKACMYMYAECCGYILMSASASCIHVGMSACFARPFVYQSVASARLSVRLMSVYHCARRFIFRLSICLIFRPSVCMSVCMYVHMYLCRDERTSVCTVDIEN